MGTGDEWKQIKISALIHYLCSYRVMQTKGFPELIIDKIY